MSSVDERAAVDKRVTAVALTETGTVQLARVEAQIDEFLAALRAGLAPQEQRLLSHIQAMVVRFLKSSTDGTES
jgi:DNA-binding MarR family transcriptional regulator